MKYNMNSQKVQVLMSTYNGEKYLKTQLESILAQTWKNLEIIIRDDGSSDGTVNLIKEMSKEHTNIRLIEGENVGSNKSFLLLLEESDADYVALSDQDDFWLPNKIEVAVEHLTEEDKYLMYCGNKTLVDKNLEVMPKQTYPDLKPSFESAVVENICTGCTCVLKKELVDQIRNKLPDVVIYHDWWLYLVATYYGEVYFDEKAYIYYRQHELNQVGGNASLMGQIKSKKKELNSRRGKLKKQLEEFQMRYQGDIAKDALVDLIIHADSNLKTRLKVVFTQPYKRQNKADSVIVCILFLFGKMI